MYKKRNRESGKSEDKDELKKNIEDEAERAVGKVQVLKELLEVKENCPQQLTSDKNLQLYYVGSKPSSLKESTLKKWNQLGEPGSCSSEILNPFCKNSTHLEHRLSQDEIFFQFNPIQH